MTCSIRISSQRNSHCLPAIRTARTQVRDPKFFRELFVAHVLWPRDLHFQIMVAAAEGTDLVVPSIDCTLADFRGVGACDATVLLGNFKVVLPAIAALNTPARAVLDQVAKF